MPASLDRERQRLVRLRADPRRRQQLEEERLYLADYITALALIDIDSKFEEFKGRLARPARPRQPGHRLHAVP